MLALGQCEPLFQPDKRSLGSVQQSPEVESGEPIVRVLGDMRRESGKRTGIARFQHCKCRAILSKAGILIDLRVLRLECTDRLGAPAQDKVPDRPSAKLPHPLAKGAAYADARPKLLVRRFQPRRDIHRISIGRVIEEPAAAKIPDDRGPGVHSDACRSELNSLAAPPLAERLRPRIER